MRDMFSFDRSALKQVNMLLQNFHIPAQIKQDQRIHLIQYGIF